MNSVTWLQRWYFERCNDLWEHTYDISIETLDNPGWLVKIELTGTPMQGVTLPEVGGTVDHSGPKGTQDWLNCKVEDDRFIGAGGPLSLFLICDVFRNWVEQSTTPEQAEPR